jgi:enoyl-CoA hydratase/carnithine racemase
VKLVVLYNDLGERCQPPAVTGPRGEVLAEAATYQTLLLEHHQGVGVITLNRPDQMNAFNAVMTAELTAAMTALDDDDETRVILVTGAGRAFSAGADMAGGSTPGTADDAAPTDSKPPAVPQLRPWELRTPIVAAINGAAVGMGLTYPLMWDIRIAAEDAKLGLVFTRRGLVPEGNASWLLSRLVGASVALELLLSGRIFTGAEAAQMGLVTRAVPRAEVLDTAMSIAVDIAQNTAPGSVAVTKRMFYKYLEQNDRWAARVEELEMFRWATGQPDAGEGVRSFLEKRPPEWTGVGRDDLPEGLW